MRLYVLQISSWPTDLSSSETVVHSLYTLELKIAARPVKSEPFPWWGMCLGQSPEIHPQSHWMSDINTEVHPRSFKSQLTTFSSCKGWSVLRVAVIFKPWQGQGCCFRTEKRYIHFHLAWQHCHDFEFQIRKAKPENCATPSGRSMENRLRYEEICSAYLLLGQSHILHSELLGKSCTSPSPYAHNMSHSRRNFKIFGKKTAARIQQCSIKVLGVLIPWKGTKGKFTDILSSLGTIFQLACWLAWRVSIWHCCWPGLV